MSTKTKEEMMVEQAERQEIIVQENKVIADAVKYGKIHNVFNNLLAFIMTDIRAFRSKFNKSIAPENTDMPSLTINYAGESYTDGKRIVVSIPHMFLGKMTAAEYLVMLKGLLIHEVAHIWFSDMKAYKAFIDWVATYLKDNHQIPKKIGQMIAKGFGNGTEDGRIEFWSMQLLKGTKGPIQSLRKHWYVNQPLQEEKDAQRELFDFLFAVVTSATMGYLPLGFAKKYENERAMELINELQPKIKEAVVARSNEELLEICKEMIIECGPYFEELVKADPSMSEENEQFVLSFGDDGESNPAAGGSGGGQEISKEELAEALGMTEEEVDEMLEEAQKRAKNNKSKGKEEDSSTGEGKEKGKEESKEKGKEEGKDGEEKGEGSSSKEGEEGEENESNSSKGEGDKSSSSGRLSKDDFSKNKSKDQQGNKQEEAQYQIDMTGEETVSDDGNLPTDEQVLAELNARSEAEIKDMAERIRQGVEYANEREFYRQRDAEHIINEADIESIQNTNKHMKGTNFKEVVVDNLEPYELPDNVVEGAELIRERLLEILRAKETKVQRHLRRGRVDARNLHKLSTGSMDVMKLTEQGRKTDVCAYILQDGSGSMSGTKWLSSAMIMSTLETAFKGILPMKITVFTTGYNSVMHYCVKDFGFNDPMLNYAESFFKVHGAMNGNFDGFSIRVATKEILKRPEKDKVLFVLSDGIPAEYSSTEAAYQDVNDAVMEAQNQGVNVVSVIVGDARFRQENRSAYERMYGENVISCELNEIAEEISEVITKLVEVR